MRDLVRHLIEALEQDRELIVCQVVETRGSTPQKAGSMMIIDPDGEQVGTLGGGCVENEVKQKAIQQIGEQSAAVHSFVLDHDYAWADGLICGGKMVVLTQAVRGTGPLGYFREFDQVIEEGRGFTEAIVVDDQASRRRCDGHPLLVRRRGSAADELAGRRGARRTRWSGSFCLPNGPNRRFTAVSRFCPTGRVFDCIVVGAGHVGQAVASLAAGADFDVWVVDDRHQYANRERFPTAQRLLVGPIDEVLPTLEITPETYALIVTRGHGHDQEALCQLAPTAAAYVGLIGSRRKIRLIFESLREAGISADGPGARGRAGRPGYRLADGARDRDQHRGRADRPSQPGPARRDAPISWRDSSGARPRPALVPGPTSRAKHDRGPRSRRRPRVPGWADPSCSSKSRARA